MPDTKPPRIGVDLGGTKIEVAALAPDGTEMARERVPTPAGDYDATLGVISEMVGGFDARFGRGSVGVGIPGCISPATGVVKNANSTWLIGRPLHRDLEIALARPVRVANDADCLALSEAVDGAAATARTSFSVILGTGVGGGLVAHGHVLTGPNAVGGEWGHNPLPWPQDFERPGPRCYCGRRGCIETWLSGPGMTRDDGRGLSPVEIAAGARAGDMRSQATLARYCERLARGLATVINLIDPEVVVVGGGLSNLDVLYDQVPAQWGAWVFSDTVTTELRRARHGDSSGVRGAAWLWAPPKAVRAV